MDSLLTLCNLRLSQNRKPEASAIIGVVYEKVSAIRKAIRARTIVADVRGDSMPTDQQGTAAFADSAL